MAPPALEDAELAEEHAAVSRSSAELLDVQIGAVGCEQHAGVALDEHHRPCASRDADPHVVSQRAELGDAPELGPFRVDPPQDVLVQIPRHEPDLALDDRERQRLQPRGDDLPGERTDRVAVTVDDQLAVRGRRELPPPRRGGGGECAYIMHTDRCGTHRPAPAGR